MATIPRIDLTNVSDDDSDDGPIELDPSPLHSWRKGRATDQTTTQQRQTHALSGKPRVGKRDNDDELFELAFAPLHDWREGAATGQTTIQGKRPRPIPGNPQERKQDNNRPIVKTELRPQMKPPNPSTSTHRSPAERREDDDDDNFDYNDDDDNDNDSITDGTALTTKWEARKHRDIAPVDYQLRRPSSSDDSVTGRTCRTTDMREEHQELDPASTYPPPWGKRSKQHPATEEQIQRWKRRLVTYLRNKQGKPEQWAKELGREWAREERARLSAEELERVKTQGMTRDMPSTQWPGSMGSSSRIAPGPAELRAHLQSPQDNTATHSKIGASNSGSAVTSTGVRKATTAASDQMMDFSAEIISGITPTSLSDSRRDGFGQASRPSKPKSAPTPQVNQGIKRTADGRAKATPNVLQPEVQSRQYDTEGRANAARLSRLGLPIVDAPLPSSSHLPPIAAAPRPVPVQLRSNGVQKGWPATLDSALTPTRASSLMAVPPATASVLSLKETTSPRVARAGDLTASTSPKRTQEIHSSYPAPVPTTAVPSSYPAAAPMTALPSAYPTAVVVSQASSSSYPAAAFMPTPATSTPSARLPAFNLVLTPRTGQPRDSAKDIRIAELVSFFETSRKSLTPGSKAMPEEDELVDLLKDYIGVTWEALGMYFLHRTTWHSLQSRYSERTRRKKGTLTSISQPRRSSIGEPMSFETVQSRPQARRMREPSVLEDSSMSEAAPSGPPRRSRRAAAEAKKPGAYTINRKSFGDLGEAEDDANHDVVGEHVSGRTTSAIIQRKGLNLLVPVTRIGDAKPLPDHRRLQIESERDSAATSSMLNKIGRTPWIEKKAFPKQLRLHKRPSIDINRPYLSYHERHYLQNVVDSWNDDAERWTGKVLHTDFTDAEVAIIEPYICQVILGTIPERDRPLKQFVAELMTGAAESQIRDISRRVQSCGVYINRTKISIESYLTDIAKGQVHATPSVMRMRADVSGPRPSHFLRRRELGLSSSSGRRAQDQDLLKYTLLHKTLGPSLVFKKASSDVTNVAWSPNGQYFAAGSTALMDSHSMQYNRRNNLLIGDRSTKTLQELPNHAIKREAPVSGANASQAMHESQDPLLYTTISAVKFSPDSTVLFTAGYDNVARVWDITKGLDEPSQRWQFRHKAPLDLLEVSDSGLFATGAKRASESIKVLKYHECADSGQLVLTPLASPKALERPELDVTPSVIRWGPRASSQDKYLVAGFTSASRDLGGEGEMCVWDVEAQIPLVAQRGGRSVFDIAWSPSTFGRIAVASSPIGFVNRGTNSIVRIYDSFRSPTSPFSVNAQNAYELECPALDVNDVIFNPTDSNLITMGCTDGRVYVWDLRNPDQILHSFAHGKSLVELDQAQAAEAIDTGIRFVHWGESQRNLFSGSSDGVVALWDPYVSPEDSNVRKVVQLGSGVMSGAFSPDFSNLLLGEEDGTVTMLSVGYEDATMQDCERFNYRAANQDVFDEIYDTLDIVVPDQEELAMEGRRAAADKMANDDVKWQPLAGFPRGQIVQGLNYDGPYDTSAEAPALRAKAELFQKKLRHNGNQCHLTHELPPLTEEEMGDSGAWRSRIPEFSSCPSVAKDNGQASAASVSESSVTLCFRCNISALAPASSGRSGKSGDVLECHECRLAWRVEVLGYTGVDYYTKKPVKQLDVGGLEVLAAKMTLADLTDDHGLAQNVQAWAHSLWGTEM